MASKQIANGTQPMIKRSDKFAYFQCHTSSNILYILNIACKFFFFIFFNFHFMNGEREDDDDILHTGCLTKFAIFIQSEMKWILFLVSRWSQLMWFIFKLVIFYLLSFSIKLKIEIYFSSSFYGCMLFINIQILFFLINKILNFSIRDIL